MLSSDTGGGPVGRAWRVDLRNDNSEAVSSFLTSNAGDTCLLSCLYEDALLPFTAINESSATYGSFSGSCLAPTDLATCFRFLRPGERGRELSTSGACRSTPAASVAAISSNAFAPDALYWSLSEPLLDSTTTLRQLTLRCGARRACTSRSASF